MTTSVNARPAASRRRSRRSSTGGSSARIAARAASTASAGARSISTSTLRRIRRRGRRRRRGTRRRARRRSRPPASPALTASRPARTASVPARSLPKWSAFEASAGLSYRRAARSETSVRETSIGITTATAANTHHARRRLDLDPAGEPRDGERTDGDADERAARTPRRARPGAPPCRARTDASGRPGCTATPIAKNVSSAATRSVPECSASETRPRLPLARPAPSLMPISATAAPTETSAARRWGSSRERYAVTLIPPGDTGRPTPRGQDPGADQQAAQRPGRCRSARRAARPRTPPPRTAAGSRRASPAQARSGPASGTRARS